jgi:cellulose synthase/poly-beta-1,6-N-acetylglucosamine synthase-like glycosyltransferase
MEMVAALTFWVSAGLIAYGYVGYPLLMHVVGRFRGRPNLRGETWPRVSLLVPAYNEGHVIEAKIQNCVELDYPSDRLEVFVASDGSTDATAELIEEAARSGRIRGVVYRERRGKAAVLNDLVALAPGEILMFSDASTMIEPGSLRALVENFADPRVGCVSGVYRLAAGDDDGKAGPEALYWRYETFVRQAEARLGRMLGAHGALYGIRRELFEPLRPGTRNEDFLMPVRILMKGYRTVYDHRAIASEDAREMTGFARRVGLAMGNYQQLGLLARERGWLRHPRLVFQLVSHKVLRLVTPLLLLTMYASSARLLASPGYRVAFAAQTVFFIAALLGLSAGARRRGKALIGAPYYFCMVNAATLAALYRIVRRSGLGGLHAKPGALQPAGRR